MDRSRLQYLFQAQLEKTISEEERVELFQFLNDAQNETAINEHISEIYLDSGEQLQMKPEVADDILNIILNTGKESAKVRRIGAWTKWVAAAAIVLFIVGGWWWMERKSEVGGQKTEVARTNDVEAPKDSRAVITLADGSKVYLDSVTTGTIATQSNITVERSADGKIVYQPANGITTEIVYNTLTNPRGSKVIDMQLSDGSHVWLNAGSSVKYPVAFVGNERKVEITGEAYFEVAHNASKPFIVSKGDVSVQVLGTHFNVNAYDDEPNLKVTLLEGSVKVSKGISNAMIKPGQQAQVSSGVKVVNDADLEAVMAWKNGEFQFGDKSDISSVMREISRWYDVHVEMKGEIKGHIGGSISRGVNISKVLQMLEATGMIQYKIEGKKVIITP